MPTKYNAKLDHVPDYKSGFDSISSHVDGCSEAVQNLLLRCGADAQDLNWRLLASDIVMKLTTFALACGALAPRTPRMLIATVSKIARDPQAFLETSEKFDPEASAMVWDEIVRQFPATRILVANFELGIGSGPLPSEIALAARTVLERLEVQAGQQNRGRPHLELQTNLACDLGRIFRAHGGKITRITFDGETGPFHDFLKLLLPSVSEFAKTAGFSLTVTTMVEKAQTVRRVGPRKPNGISVTRLIP